MNISIEIDRRAFEIDVTQPLNIAIPLLFGGVQPNAYGVEKAVSAPCEAGALVGDTRRGGSCNFERYALIPHCNGTHTESIGHITHERISVHDCLRDSFIQARLISVEPAKAFDSKDTYAVEINDDDLLITRKALEKAYGDSDPETSFLPQALIVRALPNDESKLSKTYLEEIPPFFSTEAMHFMREAGINHLLVDTPSIDRIFDDGKLSNHRIFWQIAEDSFEISPDSLIHNTITELIYVPEKIADGNYLLNLQIAPFASDASPSRPVLYAVHEKKDA